MTENVLTFTEACRCLPGVSPDHRCLTTSRHLDSLSLTGSQNHEVRSVSSCSWPPFGPLISQNSGNLRRLNGNPCRHRGTLKRSRNGICGGQVVERVTGIEPASSAWKAEVLAIELHPRER